MQLSINSTFNLNLMTPELRLVTRALRGVLEIDEEKEQAKILANRIAEQRIAIIKQQASEMAKLEENLRS